jgi:hypothetical protein
MAALSRQAREEIKARGLTIVGYIRYQGWLSDGWHGDACGCSDDRCIGYHHDAGDTCGCLEVLLDDYADSTGV